MLRFVPRSFVPRLTGLVFALAILAALGVGAFSPGATEAAPEFTRRAPTALGTGGGGIWWGFQPTVWTCTTTTTYGDNVVMVTKTCS